MQLIINIYSTGVRLHYIQANSLESNHNNFIIKVYSALQRFSHDATASSVTEMESAVMPAVQ